jgi:predicted RNA binding protein YcfA (HicA-like mRNA interferase family)
MPKLINISGKELLNKLLKKGFFLKRQESSHFFIKHQDGRKTSIPIHKNKDLPKGTLKAILKDIGFTNEDLINL